MSWPTSSTGWRSWRCWRATASATARLGAPEAALVDLQYSDVRPDKGLYHRLVTPAGCAVAHPDAQVAAAVLEPPEDTRAYFRGRCLAQYAEHVAAASWDSVIFDVPGRRALQRVPTLEPLRGTKAHVGSSWTGARPRSTCWATLPSSRGHRG
jgi:Pup amidohydrolase